MGQTNYFSGIVKLLESPVNTLVIGETTKTEFRAEFPQFRGLNYINLVCWSIELTEFLSYYKKNDYVLVEGYLYFKTNQERELEVNLCVIRLYPFLLSFDSPFMNQN